MEEPHFYSFKGYYGLRSMKEYSNKAILYYIIIGRGAIVIVFIIYLEIKYFSFRTKKPFEFLTRKIRCYI